MTNLDLEAAQDQIRELLECQRLAVEQIEHLRSSVAEVEGMLEIAMQSLMRTKPVVDAAVEYRAKHRLYGAVSHMELFAAVDAYVGNKP